MRTRTFSSPYHYIIIHISPPVETLTLRHTIQKALQQLFGVTRAGIPIDVLSEVVENLDGKDYGRVVLRTMAEDVEFVLAALPIWTNPTIRVVKHGTFLPGLDLPDLNIHLRSQIIHRICILFNCPTKAQKPVVR
ncbi:hypothetical protein OPQ81_002834 [Rhizoctonia solani]|nr:hypothetical protein OPQ81_002834 [Rhizoctonia solani]